MDPVPDGWALSALYFTWVRHLAQDGLILNRSLVPATLNALCAPRPSYLAQGQQVTPLAIG